MVELEEIINIRLNEGIEVEETNPEKQNVKIAIYKKLEPEPKFQSTKNIKEPEKKIKYNLKIQEGEKISGWDIPYLINSLSETLRGKNIAECTIIPMYIEEKMQFSEKEINEIKAYFNVLGKGIGIELKEQHKIKK